MKLEVLLGYSLHMGLDIRNRIVQGNCTHRLDLNTYIKQKGIGKPRIQVVGIQLVKLRIVRSLLHSYRLVDDSILDRCHYDTYHAPFSNQSSLLRLGVGTHRS